MTTRAKGKEGLEGAAKDDTEAHIDRAAHPEHFPLHPSRILSPVDYTSFISSRDTQYTLCVPSPAAQRLSFPKFPNIHLGQPSKAGHP